jgi:hypothetical protein
MQRQPVEHAMLNIQPDEIWLCACNQLGYKSAWDAMPNTHKRLAGIVVGIFECLLEVCGLSQGRGSVGCVSVEGWLLAVWSEVCHIDGCCVKMGKIRLFFWKMLNREVVAVLDV